MDKDKLNYTIAEKIADIFQTYTHIILEQDQFFEKYVDVELLPKSKMVKFNILEDGKFTTEKECYFCFESEEEFEDVMSDLKSVEKKLEEILKEVRK